jgi:hypothetical protein
MPYRHPGSPAHSRSAVGGQGITFYRQKGSQEVRHLIDEGFRHSTRRVSAEACRIFSEKMLSPEEDTTIGLTIVGAMTHLPASAAGGGDDGSRSRRFHHQHGREPLPSPSCAEFHAASRSPFVNDVEL